jgi:hypothetical protein
MKTKEEIRTKWIRHTPLISLDECVDNAMEEYANQCQEDMQKDVEYWQGEYDHWHQQAIDMADKYNKLLEYTVKKLEQLADQTHQVINNTN